MQRSSGRLFNLLVLSAVFVATAAAAPTAEARGPKPKPSVNAEGIDVSHYQGTIDWARVKASGKAFAFVKAAQGTTYVDPTYAANRSGARAAGVIVGAYDYASPSATPGEAVAEGDWFISHTTWASNDLSPVLDIETTGGLGVAALQQWVTDWLGEVYRLTGRRAAIYTSPSFWQTNLGDTQSIAQAGYTTLWIANWRVSSPTVPAGNWAGYGWSFWQYSDCGNVSGITGCVDLDRAIGTDLTAFLFG